MEVSLKNVSLDRRHEGDQREREKGKCRWSTSPGEQKTRSSAYAEAPVRPVAQDGLRNFGKKEKIGGGTAEVGGLTNSGRGIK